MNRSNYHKSHESWNRRRNYADRQYNFPESRNRPQNHRVFQHRDRFPRHRQDNWPRFHGDYDRQMNSPLYRDYQSSERLPRGKDVYDHSYRFYDRNTLREAPYYSGFDIPVSNRFSPLGNF